MGNPKFRAIIFDMDGVLYHAHKPLPGIKSALRHLRGRGIKVFFLTNNASLSRSSLAAKLKKMGIDANEGEIDTSAYAAAKFIRKRKAGAKVFMVGMPGLKQELLAQGLRVVGASGKPDFFANGIDFNLNYEKLSEAADFLIHSNAKWVCSNLDSTFPSGSSKGGRIRLKLGAGAITALLSCASHRKPDYVMGKPNPQFVEPILSECARHGINKSEIALVGDRLDTDIALANRAGIVPILVLTGVATLPAAKKSKGENKPKYVIKSAAELPKLLGI